VCECVGVWVCGCVGGWLWMHIYVHICIIQVDDKEEKKGVDPKEVIT